MKKLLIIVVMLACLLGLVGCDPGEKSLDLDELLNNTTKIELVYYDNTNPKIITVKHFGKNTPEFDFSKVTLIETLDDSLIEDFVTDISEYEFLSFPNTSNEPIGKTIILYQNNGNMIVLFGCEYENKIGIIRYYDGCNVFDENGMFVEYIGSDGGCSEILAEKYFE